MLSTLSTLLLILPLLAAGAIALDLDITADEPANGLLARIANVPGLPPVKLALKGAGPLDAFAARARSDALALVRDDAVWSQLSPGDGPGERFRIFRFHFPEGVDNSGFVGWLASRLKLEFGTGVFVICGQNSGDGGIFDYWGVPEMLGDVVTDYVRKLCANDPDPAQGLT